MSARATSVAMLALWLAACSGDTEKIQPSRLPPAYPVPPGGALVDTVALGTTISYVYAFPGDEAALLEAQSGALAASPWHAEQRADRLISEAAGYRVIAHTAKSTDGATLTIEVVTGEAPLVVEKPLLEGPPPSYPRGFPFVPGGRLHAESTSPAAVEIEYRNTTRAKLATRLRTIAESARWMCTQGERRFVCALGGRNVDVTLWWQGETLRLVITETKL